MSRALGCYLPARPLPHPPALIIPLSRQLSRQSPSRAAEYQTRRRGTRFPIKESHTRAVSRGAYFRLRGQNQVASSSFVITPGTSCSPNPTTRAFRRHSTRKDVFYIFVLLRLLCERPPEFTVTHFHVHVADMECSQAAAIF